MESILRYSVFYYTLPAIEERSEGCETHMYVRTYVCASDRTITVLRISMRKSDLILESSG